MARRKEHDRYCPQAKWNRDDAIEWWTGCQTDFDCRCDLIALVRADQDMIDYAKHLELDYEHTRESWEAGYKEGKAAEREACIQIVQTVGADHQNNAGRNVWRNEALVKLGYTGHI